ncbi:MAG: AAA family ATPase [Chloroflexi bacterium]|nr:AAA family ATPase [Chloroflexota bacterium]
MTARADALLEGLNPPQRQAVQCVDGPLLIVAGPGSGKTRVITHRIAYLNRHVGISPRRIAAVTFTNRAAREMRNRLTALMGDGAQRLTAGTFHALCASVLRRDGEVIGIPPDYVIMDDEDQMNLIKQSMEQLQLDPKRFPPRSVLSAISRAKSQLLGPDALAAKADGHYDEVVHRVFAAYQASLARSHGVDFDDLLGKAVELFRRAPEIRDRWQERFIHFMVDEFQDTNTAQYEIARLLAGKHRNLAVVGDPDQSIYSWRNADIRNILSFKKDYPDATIVALSQNYRSTRTILDAARHVIRANSQRIEQELFTENGQGVPIRIADTYSEEEEAQEVIREVQRLMEHEGVTLRDCVVTYRVNAQSRALEEACLRYGMPYKIVGGVRFYQRREVKDLICYLRLLENPFDEVSLTRVINVPARGIGKRTVDELLAWANSRDVPAYTGLQMLESDDYHSPFDARQKRQLTGFLSLLNGLSALKPEMELPQLIDEVLEQSGLRRAILESDDPDAEDRLENLRELRGLSAEFADASADESLPAFLERIALVSDQDVLDEDEQQYITLITLHQIKGLEFPVVFITGMEDGVLPHMRSIDDPDQLEEERRIAYVGMTRARDRLYLFRSLRRRMFGSFGSSRRSRFLKDIPFGLLEAPERGQRFGNGDTGRPERELAAVGADGAPVQAPPFKTGEKVTHPVFGLGIVVDCSPRPGDYEVTVAFPGNQGVKRILHSYGKLEGAQRS